MLKVNPRPSTNFFRALVLNMLSKEGLVDGAGKKQEQLPKR